MIPIFNSRGRCEFNLVLGRKILRCCFEILKAFKANVGKVEIHLKDSPKFSEISDFIAKIFYRHYGAKIKISAPKIMSLVAQNGQMISALAIRPAAGEKLFLEQYFDQSIEDILSTKLQKKVRREEIVEIGSLASKRKHAARFLYISLAAYLQARGYKYVVATGTDYLFKYFKKAHMNPQILGEALRSRLTEQEMDWGSYYDSNPQVMLIDVKQANQALGGFLGIIVIPCLNDLYPTISYKK